MFQKAELKRLQAQKDLLVLQSDANRLRLALEWQRLRSPEHWLDGAGQAARRHPIWTAVLSAVAGALTVQTVRKPGSILGGVQGLGKIATIALSVWRLFRSKKTEE
jgi:hypothetical protein